MYFLKFINDKTLLCEMQVTTLKPTVGNEFEFDGIDYKVGKVNWKKDKEGILKGEILMEKIGVNR